MPPEQNSIIPSDPPVLTTPSPVPPISARKSHVAVWIMIVSLAALLLACGYYVYLRWPAISPTTSSGNEPSYQAFSETQADSSSSSTPTTSTGAALLTTYHSDAYGVTVKYPQIFSRDNDAYSILSLSYNASHPNAYPIGGLSVKVSTIKSLCSFPANINSPPVMTSTSTSISGWPAVRSDQQEVWTGDTNHTDLQREYYVATKNYCVTIIQTEWDPPNPTDPVQKQQRAEMDAAMNEVVASIVLAK